RLPLRLPLRHLPPQRGTAPEGPGRRRRGGERLPRLSSELVEWGVPRTAILVDARSRTTRENAVETERILTARGARSLLLVTSALHMPRAVAAFRKTRLSVIPSPTDYLIADPENAALLDWFPSPDSMTRFQAALWE